MKYFVRQIDSSKDAMDLAIDARYQAWGDPLSRLQFFNREAFLAKTAWVRSGLKTYGLFTNDQIVASCETLPIRARAPNEEQQGLAIASVVVPEAIRQQGHASYLLKSLMEKKREEADFFCLFSEIGTRIYERCGFTGMPNRKVTFSVDQTMNPIGLKTQSLNRESALIAWRSSMNSIGGPVLLPLSEQLEWNWDRSDFYARTLGHSLAPIVGFEFDGALLIFTADFKFQCLKILHMSRPNITKDSNWIQIWKDALLYAHLLGLTRLIAWVPKRAETNLAIVQKVFSGTISDDHEDIPMFYQMRLPSAQIEVEYQCWV